MREAGRLEVRARPRVDERPPVARDPAGEPFAAVDRHLLDDVGVGAGREAAAQRFGLLVVEEERGARERHEVGQLGGDERHRVRHAEAGAHRLRDLVERVDFAVRERDVLEDVLLRRIPAPARSPAARAPSAPPLPAGAGSDRAAAPRPAAPGSSSLNSVTTCGSSPLPASCCSRPIAASDGHRLVVRPLRHQRVEVVDDREDARAERDLLALQARRIALAVPALVVAQDQRRHRIRERHRAHDVGADLRMGADLLELFGRQRPRLREDVLGHGQLADVVQQRRRLHALDLVLAHPEAARQRGGVELHAPDVQLRGLILRVDRERQRFDRRQVQVRHLLRVAALVFDAPEIDLVGCDR